MQPSPLSAPTPSASTMEELLAHADWIHELAAKLIKDPSAAEDLAQDTLMAAVESPPSALQNPRAWLATVLRNRMRSRFQRESQRRQRESDCARPDVELSTDTLFERADLQHELVARVLELDDIYKETLLLRYFEGLDPRQVARRLGVESATVRTRTRRGLERLRLQLDKDYGDRSTWSLALVPLLRPKGPRVKAGRLLDSKLLVGAALGSLSIALAWVFIPMGADPHPGVHAAAPVALTGTGTQPPEPLQAAEAKTSTRQSLPVPSSAAPLHLIGRVVDEFGRPASGLRILWNQSTFRNVHDGLAMYAINRNQPGAINEQDRAVLDKAGGDLLEALRSVGADDKTLWWTTYFMEHEGVEPFGESDASGEWDIELPGGFPGSDTELERSFRIEGSANMLIASGLEQRPDGSLATVLVCAPAVSISGWVQDTEGNPLAGVSFATNTGLQGLRSFPLELDQVQTPNRQPIRSADDGAFTLADLPAFEGNAIRVSMDGFASASVLVPNADLNDLVVQLSPKAKLESGKLTGVVVDPAGVPVAGADVWIGIRQTKTDTSGHFSLDAPSRDSSSNSHILATKRGYQLARQPWDQATRDRGSDFRLQLGPPPLSITGRIVSAHGPTAGWLAVLLDGTYLGSRLDPAESQVAQATNYAMNQKVIRVEDNGSFAFAGLSDRDYTLRFWNMIDAKIFDLGPLPAGSHDVLARPNEAPPIPLVSGVVSDSSGAPLADVTVDLTLSLSSGPVGYSRPMQRTITGVDGSFRFEQIPSASYGIEVHGDGVADKSWPERTPEALSAPLNLTADATYRFQLVLDADDPADRFAVFAGGPYPVLLSIHEPWLTVHGEQVRRDDSGFPITEVSCRAQQLVLYKGQLELRRISLEPHRGAVERLVIGRD